MCIYVFYVLFRVRIPTLGVSSTRILMDDAVINIYDVGGQVCFVISMVVSKRRFEIKSALLIYFIFYTAWTKA